MLNVTSNSDWLTTVKTQTFSSFATTCKMCHNCRGWLRCYFQVLKLISAYYAWPETSSVKVTREKREKFTAQPIRAARRSIQRYVYREAVTSRRYGIICVRCFMQHAWSCSFFFNNVILARNRQLPDDDGMIETCRCIFKSFNVNNLSVCIGWCADQVTLRSARCNDEDDYTILFGGFWRFADRAAQYNLSK